ncbi:hypothetical protein WJX81_005038 [Elliptochloris bilobata]|uniref:P-type domain-containing protein n=1 Tax=Elliptochloris bilobata TaxID=381761 RepID=A0AAW1Q9S9_9CHLO
MRSTSLRAPAPCGSDGVGAAACTALGCCFDATAAQRCAHPSDVETRTLDELIQQRKAAASSAAAEGLAPSSLAIGEDLWAGYSDSCRYGMPAMGPEVREGMTWGIGWRRYHDLLSMRIAAGDQGPANTTGYQAVFYGDSILEHFMGSSGGVPEMQSGNASVVSPDMAAMRAVWNRHFGFRYRSAMAAISGDQVGHLWWRMLHGELPAVNQPGVVVVLIGTNDLGAAADCEAASEEDLVAAANRTIAARTRDMLAVVRRALPDTHVVLMGVLPRGASLGGRNAFTWPNRFTNAIAALNARYESFAEGDPMIHYLYCSDRFVNPDGEGIVKALMSDGLHPHAPGLEVISDCLAPLVAKSAGSASEQSRVVDCWGWCDRC